MGRTPSAYRFYVATFFSIGSIAVILQIASLGPLRDRFWGFHLLAFVHPAVAVLGWLCVALSGFAVLRTPADPVVPAPAMKTRRSWMLILGTAAACGVLFWILRAQNLFLGDGLPLTVDLAKGQSFHPREPLTMWLQQQFFRYIGPLVAGGADAQGAALRSVATGSVVAGVLFAVVAVALGRSIARDTNHGRATAWLVAAVILAQGYVQLFFGYVENYTYFALAIAVYLWFALGYLSGSVPLVLPGVALILAVVLHLSGAVLVPSFVVLGAWGLARSDRRRGALLDLAICMAVLLGVQQLFRIFFHYDFIAALLDVSHRALGQTEELIPNYMTSARHVRDFVNEQFLIGPLGLFLFLPAAVFAVVSRRRDIVTVFLLGLGVPCLAAAWLAGDSNLGYARNWDLLAPLGICFTVAAIYLVVRDVPSSTRFRRLIGFGLVISVVHTAAWIWINHNEALALARLKSLPLGLGRTEVVVANWYLRHGRRDEAAEWCRRAIDANPNQVVAYGFLGRIAAEEGRLDDAQAAYARAVALRPDKPEYHHNYAMALLEGGRDEEALQELDQLTVMRPDRREYWILMAGALTRLGRESELRVVNERLLAFAESDLANHPDDEAANIEAGIRLARLGREDEALARFERALATHPESAAGLLNLASLLIQMGRPGEARPVLQHFLERYPDHANAAWAREQLRGMEP